MPSQVSGLYSAPMSLESLPFVALLVLYFVFLIGFTAGGVVLIVKSRKKAWKIIVGAILILLALMMLPFLRIMAALLYLTVTGQGFGA